jgi:hypothetical protein
MNDGDFGVPSILATLIHEGSSLRVAAQADKKVIDRRFPRN